MANIRGVDHCGIRCFDMAKSKRFWCGILGLQELPEKENWLGLADGRQWLHLMPAQNVTQPTSGSREDETDLANHVAIEVTDLKAITELLLQNGCKPYQAEIDTTKRRAIDSADGPLDFGIGTVFTEDPAGNIVEFVQRDHGIFGKLKAEGAIN